MTRKHVNIRQIALTLLERIGEQGGYSHLVIDQQIKKHQLYRRDANLLTEMVYGTLQRKLTLEYDLSLFLKKKRPLDNWVKWLLSLSFYQMKYLDRIPEHAIIHEAVGIAKRRGHKGIANFVNGILRSAQRQGFPSYGDIEDPLRKISIETSHPYWLVKRWTQQYGLKTARAMCEANLQHKRMAIRIQPLHTTREELMTRLEHDHFEVKETTVSNQGIIMEQGNILHHDSFQEGLYSIQDISSMLVGEMMDVKEGMTVLDACSAPGGKTTHIAEKMMDQGNVYAYDLHKKKAKLVQQKAEELGLQTIQAAQADARELQKIHPHRFFDRILIDAPCSGLGVLRSKPDIKYSKQEKDIFTLADIQMEILQHVHPLLKQQGKLIYSTCTVDKQENEEVISAFLEDHEEWIVDPAFFEDLPSFLQDSEGRSEYGIQIFPQTMNSDGFFITRLKREVEGKRGVH